MTVDELINELQKLPDDNVRVEIEHPNDYDPYGEDYWWTSLFDVWYIKDEGRVILR
ncbi:MAG: hypothetical protein ACXABD_17220 [Candidatus Thorarchaeota archaeon]|jgi:hypothetical protein